MPNREPFRLNRSGLLLALVSAAFAGQATAAAGRVDFTIGGATVSGADGREKPLTKGAELDSGDTVRTNNGRAQIRFSDGAYVSLQPNTDFSIKEYRFEGKTDGSERGFFALAKGAMRAVTGLIGRVNRSRYAITTPTATVGIRGTGGLIAVNSDGSTTVTGTSGIWILTNPSGTLDVPAGTVGVAPSNPTEPPKQGEQPPSIGPTPPPLQPLIIQGEKVDENGRPIGLLTPLVSGSGYAVSTVYSIFGFAGSQNTTPVDAIFNAEGQLTDFKVDSFTSFSMLPGSSHADFGTDGILAWGRWIGPVAINACEGPCGTNDYTANQGLHYVIGMPTPVMPATGTATYTLLGATQPTYVSGSSAPGTFSGSLTVAFGASAAVDGAFNVAMPDGKGYSWTARTTTPNALFSMSSSASGTGGACLSGCSASVQGFFSGASAERAGISYDVNDSIANQTVIGAAAFKKQ